MTGTKEKDPVAKLEAEGPELYKGVPVDDLTALERSELGHVHFANVQNGQYAKDAVEVAQAEKDEEDKVEMEKAEEEAAEKEAEKEEKPEEKPAPAATKK